MGTCFLSNKIRTYIPLGTTGPGPVLAFIFLGTTLARLCGPQKSFNARIFGKKKDSGIASTKTPGT